jgi:hypothetical protein
MKKILNKWYESKTNTKIFCLNTEYFTIVYFPRYETAECYCRSINFSTRGKTKEIALQNAIEHLDKVVNEVLMSRLSLIQIEA